MRSQVSKVTREPFLPRAFAVPLLPQVSPGMPISGGSSPAPPQPLSTGRAMVGV